MGKGDVIYAVRPVCLAPTWIAGPLGIISNQLQDGWLTYRHYGIDMGDGNVIHFIGDGSEFWTGHATVQRTSRTVFVGDSPRYRIDRSAFFKFSRDEIAERAESMLNTDFRGYDWKRNNCEHFAMWCATGKRSSRQVFYLNDDQDIVQKAIDRTFEPLLRFANHIDRLFGWGE